MMVARAPSCDMVADGIGVGEGVCFRNGVSVICGDGVAETGGVASF